MRHSAALVVALFVLSFSGPVFGPWQSGTAMAEDGPGNGGVGQTRKKPIILKKKTYTPDDLKKAARESETRTVTIQGLEGRYKVTIPDPFWTIEYVPDYSSNALDLAKFMPELAARLTNRFLRTKDLNARHKIIRKAIKNLKGLITILDARISTLKKDSEERSTAETQRRLVNDALDALDKWKDSLDDEKDARDKPKPVWNWGF